MQIRAMATRILFFHIAAALALSSAPGCKKSADTGGGRSAEKPQKARSEKAGEPTAEQAESAKLAASIECLNRHTGRVFEAQDAYLQVVDAKTGSSHGKKPPILGLYGTDACERGVKTAGALTPAVPELDKASDAYVSALKALFIAYEELSGYYEKGDYLEDKGQKATTLHPKAMGAFKSFAEANRELSSIVKKRNRMKRENEIAAREKAEGRNLEVIIDTMMLEAETLVAMISSPDVNLAALEPQIALYNKLADEVDTYATAHTDEAKNRGSMGNLRNYDKTFLSASRVVARKLRSNAVPTAAELDAVRSQYNSLVDNYNNH
jgi:hypothetical protein